MLTTNRSLFLSLPFFLAACGNQTMAPVETDRIVIENDESILNQRVQVLENVSVELSRSNSTSTIKPSPKHTIQQATKLAAGKMRLMLRAEVPPPTLEGHRLYATHVTFDKKHAYVSYSTKNDAYRGGVEIFDINHIRRPKLRSQALFLDTDITIARQNENRLFLGEATDSDQNDDFATPACLEVIHLRSGVITRKTTRVDLPSFNANDVACFDETVFVTAGTTDGRLIIFQNHGTNISKTIAIPGAKAVKKHRDYVLVLEGTGTRLHLVNRTTCAFVKTIDLGCTNDFQGKAEMDVDGDRVYISAGSCGMLALDLASETVVTTIPAPDNGVTNGVSVTNGFVFLANGTDGLQVAQMTDSGCDILGSARFEGSTNFVAADGEVVFVANGLGGLKILEIVR
ncbi:MAG: hypothetical protein ACE5IY_04975 [bacterium]